MTYEPHSELQDIEDPDTVLWRYVDLCKWLDLLQTSELHLTRADQMEDRWEGSFSEVNIARRPTVYGEHWDIMAPSMTQLYRFARTHTYLNCWHVGECESAGMWEIYGVEGKGVAIRTTAGRLKESLTGTREQAVSGAKVQYVSLSARRPVGRPSRAYDPVMGDRKTSLTVAVDPRLAAYAEQLVETGKAADVSAVVNDALSEKAGRDALDRLRETAAQADPARVDRMLAHIDAQAAALPER